MAEGTGHDVRLTAARAALVLAVLALALLLYYVRGVIVILYLSMILAVALRPIVLRVGRFAPHAAATIVVYLALLALAVALIGFVGPQLAEQVREFIAALPSLVGQVTSVLGVVVTWAEGLGVQVDLTTFSQQLRGELGRFLFGLLGLPAQLFEFGVAVFGVVALSFYWLLDRDNLLLLLFSRLDEPRRQRARGIFEQTERRLGRYVRGLVVLVTIVGVLTYVGLSLLGVPYALVLALIAASLELIPILGPVIATVPIAMVAFTQSPILGLVTMAYWFAMQQVESYLLTPMVQRTATSLSPFLVLLAVLTGGALLGIAGAFLAIPTAVLLSVLLDELLPARPAVVTHDQGESGPPG